jgi:hypothetical protein
VTWHAREVRLLLAAAMLTGCWRSSTSPAPAAPEPEPTPSTVSTRPVTSGCTRVGQNVDDLLRRSDDQSLIARADAIREVIERRCELDAWSDELRQCVGAAESVHDTDDCERFATPEQRSSLDEDLGKIENGN